MEAKLKESPENIRNFSDYGIRMTPPKLLMKLDLKEKMEILSRKNILCTFDDDFLLDFLLRFYEEIKSKSRT